MFSGLFYFFIYPTPTYPPPTPPLVGDPMQNILYTPVRIRIVCVGCIYFIIYLPTVASKEAFVFKHDTLSIQNLKSLTPPRLVS